MSKWIPQTETGSKQFGKFPKCVKNALGLDEQFLLQLCTSILLLWTVTEAISIVIMCTMNEITKDDQELTRPVIAIHTASF